MSAAREELGPVLPSRIELRLQAREVAAVAARTVELCDAGERLPLVIRQFDRMRAIIGPAVPG